MDPTRRASFGLGAALLVLGGCTGSSGGSNPGMPATMPGMPGMPSQPAGDPPTTQPPPACLAPAAPFVRRLTRWEYTNTVADVLGVHLDDGTLALLPDDLRANGFSNDSSGQSALSDIGARYAKVADATALALAQAPNWLAAFATCNATAAACRDSVVRGLGLRLFRRPLTTEESASFAAVFDAIVALGIPTAPEVAGHLVRALLQWPQFLYRLEGQTSGGGNAGTRSLDGWEVASRLSYLIWGSAPDPTLLDAAAKGDLSDPDKLRAQVTRMLAQPRARENIQRYFQEWFTLDDLDHVVFGPLLPTTLASSMKKETLGVVADQLWDAKMPLLPTMLTTRSTIFVDLPLSQLYGLGAPDADGRISLAGISNRVGLLTHAGVLAVDGGPTGSVVQRGLFVFRNILCQATGPSPPDTTSLLFAHTPSQRQESEARLQHPDCATCHGQFDPLGYGFEAFDPSGAFRTASADGVLFRQDGFIPQTTGAPVPYADLLQYMDRLAHDPRVSACVTRKVAQFAFGRAMTDGDQCMLADIQARLDASQGRTFADLVAAVAADPNLRFAAVK